MYDIKLNSNITIKSNEFNSIAFIERIQYEDSNRAAPIALNWNKLKIKN